MSNSVAKLSLAVFISGNGSNLQALIDAIQAGLPAEITVVISNEPQAYGLQRAQHAGIPTQVIDHRPFGRDHHAFAQALITALTPYQPDYILLAGFMRILNDEFIQAYSNRVLNIHPSLLPKFPGLHTYEKALKAKEKYHGCTVHIVTNDLDAGPILAQSAILIAPNETQESLKQKIQALEHQLYPKVVLWIAQGRLQCRTIPILFDGQPISMKGVDLNSVAAWP